MAKVTVIRYAAAALTLSAAGFAGWLVKEGTGPVRVVDGVEYHYPYTPVKGDVPTIGFGSTRYEDGRRVTLEDPPISRERALELARNLHREEEERFKASLDGVELHPCEFDLYLDFTGQYGFANWQGSSMRRKLKAGDHEGACHSLLNWRKVNGYDCSTLVNGKRNKVCWGVWERQLQRHNTCMAVQRGEQCPSTLPKVEL